MWTFPLAASLSALVTAPCALLRAAMVAFNMKMASMTTDGSLKKAFEKILKGGLKYAAALAALSIVIMLIKNVEATEGIKDYLTKNPRHGERDYNTAKHKSSKTPFVWLERLVVLMFVASVIGPMIVYSDLRMFDWLLAALRWFKFKLNIPEYKWEITAAQVIVSVAVALICGFWAIALDAGYDVAKPR